jgi:hypothetical protein
MAKTRGRAVDAKTLAALKLELIVFVIIAWTFTLFQQKTGFFAGLDAIRSQRAGSVSDGRVESVAYASGS